MYYLKLFQTFVIIIIIPMKYVLEPRIIDFFVISKVREDPLNFI